MRRPSVGSATTGSRAGYLVCPGCGCGQLQPPRGFLSRLLECDFCKRAFENTIVETIMQIVALPRALGKHPCDCGHPEMRRLPDGVSTVRPAAPRCCPFPCLDPDGLRRGDRWQHSSQSLA